ncbi:MAG TPA: aminotransferase class III-fold pyridoxal phosphate-dependent enzyme, partial [Pseudomonadota bacterium]|nr:aminotransferase class III-fold pyridoxal phosphate-dependent enzyme [Pseudomonadota bacterium]
MKLIEKLNVLRTAGGKARTTGLTDATIERFAARFPELGAAIDDAHARFTQIQAEFSDIVAMDEAQQLLAVQEGFVNFYADDNVNPYVAISARGPWLVTLKGAVVHDSGGYGMLGFGHAPEAVLKAMGQPHVMANIMTPSLSQLRLARALRKEVGHSRGGCPYSKFLCLNSGSESVSLAGRIADVHTKLMTDPGAPHAGWKVKRIAVKGAFHGRTELPMLYSDSTRKTYAQHLGSFKHHEHTIITVEPYDV